MSVIKLNFISAVGSVCALGADTHSLEHMAHEGCWLSSSSLNPMSCSQGCATGRGKGRLQYTQGSDTWMSLSCNMQNLAFGQRACMASEQLHFTSRAPQMRCCSNFQSPLCSSEKYQEAILTTWKMSILLQSPITNQQSASETVGMCQNLSQEHKQKIRTSSPPCFILLLSNWSPFPQ